MTFLFPFSEIKKDSKIILYGAGAVGFDFYQQLITSKYCEIAKWVDAQWQWYQYVGMKVANPKSIGDEKYDVIVVAVEREDTFLSIQSDLVAMGVEITKIFWKDQYRLQNIERMQYSKERALEEAKQAVEVFPAELLDENRMDIIIRYIYAKAVLEKKDVEKAKQLYEKMIMAIHNGEEPLGNASNAYFSDYEQKKGVEEYDKAFLKLIESMKENGFQREHFIPLDTDGKMLNGSHRLAAALALNQKVWVLKYKMLKGEYSFLKFTSKWLEENGFEEDVKRIQRNYKRIKNMENELRKG